MSTVKGARSFTLTVVVDSECIEEGKVCDSHECPVALALGEAVRKRGIPFSHVAAAYDQLGIFRVDPFNAPWVARTPDVLQDFMRAFDDGVYVAGDGPDEDVEAEIVFRVHS